MKITLTKVNKADYSARRFEHLKVFVSSDAADTIIDKWFNDNEIRNLTFTCRTWNAVRRLVTKKIESELVDLFGADKASFSAKCGCSCGCSPGFQVYGAQQVEQDYMVNRNAWVSCEFTEAELKEIEESLPKFTTKLAVEIQKQEDKAIAAKAQTELLLNYYNSYKNDERFELRIPKTGEQYAVLETGRVTEAGERSSLQDLQERIYLTDEKIYPQSFVLGQQRFTQKAVEAKLISAVATFRCSCGKETSLPLSEASYSYCHSHGFSAVCSVCGTSHQFCF